MLFMESMVRFYEFLACDPLFFCFFGGQHVELTAIIRDALRTSVRLDFIEQSLEFRGQVRGMARCHYLTPSIHHTLRECVGVFFGLHSRFHSHSLSLAPGNVEAR